MTLHLRHDIRHLASLADASESADAIRGSAGALVNSLAMASLTPLTIYAFTFR